MIETIIDPSDRPRNWDGLVKLTHWGVAAAVAANALFTGEGSTWHIWIGYAMLALLLVRLVWGFAGPAEARFSAFPPSPRRALTHIGEIRRGEKVRHRSHNPLGSLMVYALWACLGTIIATGIAMAGPPPTDFRRGEATEANEGGGACAAAEENEENEEGEGGDEEEGPAQELHELAVNLLYVLIALHLLGVIFETTRTGRETLFAMLPGKSGRMP